jgi:hypothetical protein
MVVALHLEGNGLALADVDYAGVLTRTLEDTFAARRQPLEQERGVLVRAVLRPEKREDRELEVVRFTPEQAADSFELRVGEPEGAMERLFRNQRQRKPV